MPGIIITPGTFNPPATPIQTNAAVQFPRTKVKTLMKPWQQQQWSTRSSAAKPSYPVVYSSRVFMAPGSDVGEIKVKFEGPFNSLQPGFEVRGARWTENTIYEVTGTADNGYTANAPQIYTAGDPIAFGYHELYQGADYLSYNSMPFYLNYEVDVTGIDDDGVYEVQLIDGHTVGDPIVEGEVILRLPLSPGPPPGGGKHMLVNQALQFGIALLRNGAVFDRIIWEVWIEGEIRIYPINGEISETPQPSHREDLTMVDTLFGATASNPVSTQPTIPATSAYFRESYAREGFVTL